MDIKKAIIYSCYIIVSIVLLTHSFVPHVHHDGKVCFMHTQLHHDHGESHNNCNHNLEHNHYSPEDCNIKGFVIRPEINQNNEFSIDASFANSYIDLLPCMEINLSEAVCQYRGKPYLIHYKSVYTGSTNCLRAPPVSHC